MVIGGKMHGIGGWFCHLECDKEVIYDGCRSEMPGIMSKMS